MKWEYLKVEMWYSLSEVLEDPVKGRLWLTNGEKTERFDGFTVPSALNLLGQEGWELISVETEHDPPGCLAVLFWPLYLRFLRFVYPGTARISAWTDFTSGKRFLPSNRYKYHFKRLLPEDR